MKKTTQKQPQSAQVNDSFVNFASRLGTVAGVNNRVSQSGYARNNITLRKDQLQNMYRGDWVCGVIVDGYAEDMTREGIEITGISQDEANTLQKALTREGLWTAMTDLVRWGRLFGGAVAVINIDGEDMSKPLNMDTVGRDRFAGLLVFDRWYCTPSTTDLIKSGKNIGEPEYYDITTASGATMEVHHTRIFKQVGSRLPYQERQLEQYWGASVFERANQSLTLYNTATTSGANLLDKSWLQHHFAKGFRETMAMGGEKSQELWLKRMELVSGMQSTMGITLADAEDRVQFDSASIAGTNELILTYAQQLAGACGMPLVRLFGQSPAGLNATGESDMRMYYDAISTRQEADLREQLLKLLQIVYRSKFGKPAPEIDFDFVALWQMQKTEQADIATKTQALIIGALDAGLITTATAAKELQALGSEFGIYSNLSDLEVADLEDDQPPAPEVTNGTQEPI